MNSRMYVTLVVIVGAMILVGLDKIDAETLLALIGGSMLPSPVVRDISE